MLLYQNDQSVRFGKVDPVFRRDVLNGLASRPRTIHARWSCDGSGSKLFEAIIKFPENYIDRTVRAVLCGLADEVAALGGPDRVIVEFGSGSCAKTPILVPAVKPPRYVPIDISRDVLWESAARQSRMFPDTPLNPVVGNFTLAPPLPSAIEGMPLLGFFPGQNLLVPDGAEVLRTMATTLGGASILFVGIDHIKDQSILPPAYNDEQGVKAALNLDLLHRINRELTGSVPVDVVRHVALWNDNEAH